MKRQNLFLKNLFLPSLLLMMLAFACNNNNRSETEEGSGMTTLSGDSTMQATKDSMSKVVPNDNTAMPSKAGPNPAKKGMKGKVVVTPRMAPADAPDSKPQSFEETVFFQRFCGILRTGWSVSALSS